MKILVET